MLDFVSGGRKKILCTSQIKASTSTPGNPPPPRAFEFLENFFSHPPWLGRKAVQMPPPPGRLPDYCFDFSVASRMLPRLCMLTWFITQRIFIYHRYRSPWPWAPANSYMVNYMVIIVHTLWLAAEGALFSCNDRPLWNFFWAQRFFWVVSKTMRVYERVGENDKKDGQSITIIWITERKTGFQILLQISLVLVSVYCVYKVCKALKTGMSLDLVRGRDSWC